MCGIAAFIPKAHDQPLADAIPVLHRMVETLRFRGPDEQHVADVGGALLGHTRLSIIDLCTGSQPQFNEDGTVAVILNGEIYNYRELRRELEAAGHRFKSSSDTEVIAHLYEDDGEELFTRLNGMFAIAVWDRRRQKLIAGRDRLGEKPLIYCESGDGLVLASEVKALLAFPGIPRDIDPEAVALYFASTYVPAPLTIFSRIRKLLPAHLLVYENGTLRIREYWRPQPAPAVSRRVEELIEEFRALFADAVRLRMIADVPLGVFLSGGIDSSAVAAQMAKADQGPVRTFTVGFGDEVDERPYARMVADRYRTEHKELFVQANLLEEFERIYGYMDEPFGDSSIVPTYLVSRAARQHVKVVLTGDGGDELFAGYPMYLDQKYRSGSRVKTAATRWANRVALQLFNHDFVASTIPRSPRAFASWHDARSVFRDGELQDVLTAPASGEEFFRNRAQHWLAADSLTTAYMYDVAFYLPDDLLKKVDMASMRTSLECRAPFLDHRLVEWALNVPPALKLERDQLKSLLRRAVADLLPPEIINRSKQGFGAPVGSWLRKELRPMALDLTAPGARAERFVSRQAIDAARGALTSVNDNGDHRPITKLWLIVVLEAWLRQYS